MVDLKISEVHAKLAPVTMEVRNVVFWEILKGWTTFDKTIFVRNEKYKHEGQLKVKIHVLLYGDDSWNVIFRQMKFSAVKVMDITTSFIWIIALFDKAFNCADGVKFWGYVGTNAEPLCVEFSNFVQCHMAVNYLTFCLCVGVNYITDCLMQGKQAD
jgi:hypothetical protein